MIQIIIKAEGSPPQVIEDIRAFSLVVVPNKDPEHGTEFFGWNVNPKGLAEIGAWIIRVSKAMMDNAEIPRFGSRLTDVEQKIIRPNKRLIRPR